MTRRTWTLVSASLLALALGVLGATLPVPLVALGPGPTYDTLGTVDGTTVVEVDGLPVYPTTGQLNMTTVSVTDRLTMFSALGLWASPESQVVPREPIYPSHMTLDEIQQQNSAQFTSSEANAEAAAIGELQLPATVLVSSLVPDTPAASILQPGDELLAVAGQPIDSVRQVTEVLAPTRPGDVVAVQYRRAGEVRDVEIPLASRPDREQGLLGVVLGARVRDGDIRISLGGVGGPSAGLMFALAVVDKLTPGDLAGGRFVAGTGAIEPTGTVTPINGIPFKMRKAYDEGATVFLVPAANCEEAVATRPGDLQLVRVGTLHDAVTALEALKAGGPVPSC
ncbi:MAG TPA: PDZ domain-containing protein [Pseudonocardia sp.]|uniref:YlbL family protein n=1 Tax=Pseudonocardia sp. TaxID=60912 RepID=UPI002B4B4D10|nr:PDZ domain-containing protein [Pseudonocardia sp.]HLU56861.1 PDZ domain-containing protein [Pseudonocardia sp.]